VESQRQRYLSELYRNLFMEFNITDVHLDITDNTVGFTVDTSESRSTGRIN
jgi:hypothetical protein